MFHTPERMRYRSSITWIKVVCICMSASCCLSSLVYKSATQRKLGKRTMPINYYNKELHGMVLLAFRNFENFASDKGKKRV